MARASVAKTPGALVEETLGFNSAQLDALRHRALTDLFFLCKGILGYNGSERHVVGALANFMTHNKSMTRMQLMPRGHLKTTICTIGHTVQNACADADNSSTLVVNEIHDNAVDIVSEILGHFENNELLRILFPAIIPDKFSGPGVKWSATRGACLVPRAGKKDPSFLAAGISTAVTSKHFKHIKCDDLVGMEANQSPAALAYAKRWVDNITPLTLGPDETTVDFTGTRWALNDLYAYIMDLYGNRISVFRRGMMEEGIPIWPEKYTPAAIEQLMKRPDVYYAQYDNNPLNAASADFDVQRLGTWYQLGKYVSYTHKNEHVKTEIRDLNRLITIDPNSGSKTAKDEAGLIVTGVDSNDARLCLEDASGYYSPDELVNRAIAMIEKWACGSVGVEEAGQQNTGFYLQKECRKRGIFVRYIPLKHGNVNKQSRILKSLQPLVADDSVYLHPSQDALRRQFLGFGSGLDDRIDAFSYHTHMVRAPLSELKRKEGRHAVDRILAMRSSSTGY